VIAAHRLLRGLAFLTLLGFALQTTSIVVFAAGNMIPLFYALLNSLLKRLILDWNKTEMI